MIRQAFLQGFVFAALLCGQSAISTERLARVDDVLKRYVDQNRIPGVVALVMQDGKPVYERAFGWADKEASRKMETNTIFRIASQTKALTSAAVLILVEEGKVGLQEPVGNFIPTFRKTAVMGAMDGQTVPAKRAITVHDLLTHTAGISYGGEKPLADKDEPVCETMERLGTLPFTAQPGEKYVYGYNTDILGCVVEKASGMALDRFIESRITGPLGMKDTRFFLLPADHTRFAAVYASKEGAYERAAEGSGGQGHYVEGPRKNFAGGAGLTSTARDYARFLECIRRGGELDGVRILSPRAAKLMHTNQSGTLPFTSFW